MTVSLVLGAGGRAGVAYHAGVLLALQLHGIDIERPHAITGTSAGSLVAAMLSVGIRPEDLCALSVGADARPQVDDIVAEIQNAERRRPTISPTALARLLDVRRGIGVLAGIGSRNFTRSATHLFPGVVSVEGRLSFLEDRSTRADAPAWRLCAATESGERRVFCAGQGEPMPPSVVAASCAVPGIYHAVNHEDERLIDGGVHSSTNADLAVHDDADAVVIVAPMCGDNGLPVVTRAARRQLENEVDLLEAAGRAVIVFRPTLRVSSLMGVNLLSARRSSDITREALLSAAEVIVDSPALNRAAAPKASVRVKAVTTSPQLSTRAATCSDRDDGA